MIIVEEVVCSWSSLSDSLLSCFFYILVSVCSQSLLIEGMVAQSLVFNADPTHTKPLLEQSSGHVQKVLVLVPTDLDVES